MKRKSLFKDENVIATLFIIIVVAILFLATFLEAANVIRARSVRRMEEGVNSVVDEVISKLDKDSRLLNSTAAILSSANNFDENETMETMETILPLMETMDICVVLSDNRILQPDGTIVDGSDHIDFDEEAAQGEHVSNRTISVMDDNTLVLRHFVPIMQNGEVAALLYGRTRLDELPIIMNIDNLYNASADVYIIDSDTGEFIMDTLHKGLGTLDDFRVTKIRSKNSWDSIKQSILNLNVGYEVIQLEDENEWLNFYYSSAGINRWAIAVSVPEREALSSLYALQRVFYLTAVMIGTALLIYFIWTRRNAKISTERAVERAVLEEKLLKAEAAERAKTTFLSNMSHDIRTPMNAIIGFTTLAKTNIDNKDRVETYLSKILSSGNYLLSLINDVLDMSRIESGKLNIEDKPCTISEIFRDMRNIIQTQMRTKHLNFYMDTVDVMDEDILCDKLHVNQVLLNLLSNAIKFTPAGGSVYLTITQLPNAEKGFGSYEIRVKDTGIGMSQDFVEHIFEPFERERNTTVSGIQGTGLGMAITKSIVDAMGGTIRVETEEEVGTEFIIHLDFRLQAEQRRSEISRVLMGMHALVVDDNFSTCDSVTKMLAQLGMRAEWSMHGREAVLRARQAIELDDRFRAYIVDWALPDLSGLEVVRQIRAMAGQDAVIFVMTAYDWSAFEDEAKAAGVTAFCNKPVFLSELREVLEGALQEPDGTGETPAMISESGVPQNGKRLLLVEDNELNREIAEELLIESGFLIESVEDGSLAVEKMKTTKAGWYDLILMDVQMPIMNGYEATRAIRALSDPEKASIPIVAMTANAFQEDRQHALDSGMNDYLAKPINLEALLEIIYRLLGIQPNEQQ